MATNNADNFSNPISIANGGTGAASFDTDAPIYYNGTVFADPGVGNYPQVLTSAGSGSAPVWDLSPAGMILVNTATTTAGQATVTFTTGITSAFNTYLLVVSHFAGASTSAKLLSMQYSTNGGSSYVSTGYTNNIVSFAYNSATLTAGSAGGSRVDVTQAYAEGSNGLYQNAYMWMFNVTNGIGTQSVGQWNGAGSLGTNGNSGFSTCAFGNSAAINALQFFPGITAVNFVAGTVISLFGMQE
jgi:hypothetical protein